MTHLPAAIDDVVELPPECRLTYHPRARDYLITERRCQLWGIFQVHVVVNQDRHALNFGGICRSHRLDCDTVNRVPSGFEEGAARGIYEHD